MFLYTKIFNEGGSVLFSSGRRKAEMREGRSPGSNSWPERWNHARITGGKDPLVNQRWKRSRFPWSL